MHLKKLKNSCLYSIMTGLSILPVSSLVFIHDVHAEGALPTVVGIASIDDGKRPDIPSNSGFAVVKLNIHESNDKNSPAIGYYNKGEAVRILDNDGTWAHTDKGYVWGGYLSSTYQTPLNLHSDTELASRYVGYTYDIINQMDEKYKNVLKNYEITLCDNPIKASGLVPDNGDENSFMNGLTHYYSGPDGQKRLMYIRDSLDTIKGAMYHELGHVIDLENFGNDGYVSDVAEVEQSYNTEMPTLKEKYSLLDENTENKMEYFAEAFRLNYDDPDGLKSTAPVIYDYINQIIAKMS